jgi:type IV pilus assembly protein PilV
MTELKQRLASTHPPGFSLLEVLVGLIILAVGLLGLAGLQMVSLRQNNEAYIRSQATLQAYDILDRMRANRQYALDGEYAIDYGEQAGTNTPAAVKDDLDLWKNALNATLPGPGDGRVVMTNSTLVAVSIRWNETSVQNATQDDTWQEFTTQSEL